MKSDEPFDPIPIRSLGSQRVVLKPHDIAHPFDQARRIRLALGEALWQKMRHDSVLHGRQPSRQAEYTELFRKKRRNNSIEYSLDVCEIAHHSRTLACHDIAVRGSFGFGDAALLWLALQCRPRAGDDVTLDADLGFPDRLCVFVL